jgi:hypothetical protein
MHVLEPAMTPENAPGHDRRQNLQSSKQDVEWTTTGWDLPRRVLQIQPPVPVEIPQRLGQGKTGNPKPMHRLWLPNE